MKVVVVGPGGREACLALVLSRHHEVVVTPGNPGIPGSVVTPPEEFPGTERNGVTSTQYGRYQYAWQLSPI